VRPANLGSAVALPGSGVNGPAADLVASGEADLAGPAEGAAVADGNWRTGPAPFEPADPPLRDPAGTAPPEPAGTPPP
jgi:hypothetical protein